MAIKLNNATKRYGSEFALNDVTLHFKPGEFTGYLDQMVAGNRLH